MESELLVRIDETAADAERLGLLGDALRAELLGLDVTDVTTMRVGVAPSGTRGLDVAAVGTLLVSMNPSVELLTRLVRAVASWVGRSASPGRSVELTVGDRAIRVTDVSSEQQDRLINEFIRNVGEGHRQ